MSFHEKARANKNRSSLATLQLSGIASSGAKAVGDRFRSRAERGLETENTVKQPISIHQAFPA
jgi:hypothetical protein